MGASVTMRAAVEKCQSKQTSKCPSSLANEESTFVKKSELQVMLQELATSITTNLTTRLSQQTSYAASRTQSNPTFRPEIGTQVPTRMATIPVRLVLDDAPFYDGSREKFET